MKNWDKGIMRQRYNEKMGQRNNKTMGYNVNGTKFQWKKK